MKVSAFTISLIVIFSMFFFIAYMDKKVVDIYRESVYNLIELNVSDSAIGESYIKSEIASSDYKTAMIATFISFLLILISWKIDNLEKH